ncbi:VWA domain-containing protein [Myxococcus sp. CA051A]|uniref:vWA domain-containing protein n=1 Tax=unclassified Myxococcus TaxID=2648731 RepID=UPI00157B3F53|nr:MULTISPECIES: VWA domain-containing protein [unclassified Myxococcus]NTX55596.1 VWA domain-containing protein [Myxococcus sp. CA039A]NTX63916.1 VWA domain-containing protein [Myxococcus sp. CA051A]
MTTANQNTPLLPETQRGPAERLLDLVLSGSAHLWHNRPGLDVNGTWVAAAHATPAQRTLGKPVKPGLFVPAAVRLYRQLLDIHRLNSELMAHFASYALTQTDWRDLKVATCALMLVQEHAGQPVVGEDGKVAFHDDDWRAIGEAMVLHYERKSTRMLTPKAVLRVAELLELPDIARLNREAGFGDPASRKAPMGRWKRVASRWLAAREANLPMLQGLVKAGYKETLKKLARKAGYKPRAQGFFEVLGWKQKQSEGGHRTVGLNGLTLVKSQRFDGLSEAEICEWIELERLSYKEVVGRLPKDLGMTPAIMAALLPSLSDRDLRLMTPTLEELGLLAEPSVRGRWEKAVQTATDQRALNIAKNVRSEVLRQKLEEASDNAARQAVAEATAETDVRVMFLIDKSGSMEGAIENSKEALARILAGFPMEKLHIAAFDTMGTVLKPKASNRTAVQHMLERLKASGGTTHAAGVHALHRDGVKVPEGAKLVVIVVGDEAGEAGDQFARAFRDCGYTVAALALLVSVAGGRGNTVRTCASFMKVPFSEVNVDQFADPYQVPRVLKALLDAPTQPGASQSGWVERVMRTPLLKVA